MSVGKAISNWIHYLLQAAFHTDLTGRTFSIILRVLFIDRFCFIQIPTFPAPPLVFLDPDFLDVLSPDRPLVRVHARALAHVLGHQV